MPLPVAGTAATPGGVLDINRVAAFLGFGSQPREQFLAFVAAQSTDEGS
jgi:hypothetical protein